MAGLAGVAAFTSSRGAGRSDGTTSDSAGAGTGAALGSGALAGGDAIAGDGAGGSGATGAVATAESGGDGCRVSRSECATHAVTPTSNSAKTNPAAIPTFDTARRAGPSHSMAAAGAAARTRDDGR